MADNCTESKGLRAKLLDKREWSRATIAGLRAIKKYYGYRQDVFWMKDDGVTVSHGRTKAKWSKLAHEVMHWRKRMLTVLFIGKEVSRESRKIIRASVSVSLTPRPVELQHNHGSAPCLGSWAASDIEDGTVNRCIPLQGSRRVPEVKRESKIFAVQTLSQNDAFCETVVEEHVKNGDGALSMGASWGRATMNLGSSPSVWNKLY